MTEVNPRRVELYIRNFERALEAYTAEEPFARFLTRFFKENKQMGSSDRRMTSRLCYNFFRLGQAMPTAEPLQRLIVAEFLCESNSPVVSLYEPEWQAISGESLEAKVTFLQGLGIAVSKTIFPYIENLSATIEPHYFSLSHLIQPDLFIRAKKAEVEQVENALVKHKISFLREGDTGFRLANGSRLQDVRGIKGRYEVQDLSSQETINAFRIKGKESWWDACAASGGKSLMLLDTYPQVDLLVSDIRLSILRNLNERFEEAGVKTMAYRQKIIDLTGDVSAILGSEQFDGILLDAPCSGSGTWGRTPEMIQQFSVGKIKQFADLQKKIARNVVPYLKHNGTLIYITCSVFSDENEAVVAYLEKTLGLVVEEAGTINGYTKRADSMFVARLRKIN